MRGRDYSIRRAPGTNAFYREQAFRTDARGAGVTGVVVIDGIGFRLEGAGKCPSTVTVNPGGATAAWYQTDPTTVDGFPPGLGSVY